MNRSLAALYRVFGVDRLSYNGAVSLVRWRRDAPPVAHLSLGKENRLSPSRRSSYHRRLSSRSCIGSIAVKGLDVDDDNRNHNNDEDDSGGDSDDGEDEGEDEYEERS